MARRNKINQALNRPTLIVELIAGFGLFFKWELNS